MLNELAAPLDLFKGAIEILIYYYYYFDIVYGNLSELIYLENFVITKKLTMHSHTRCVDQQNYHKHVA